MTAFQVQWKSFTVAPKPICSAYKCRSHLGFSLGSETVAASSILSSRLGGFKFRYSFVDAGADTGDGCCTIMCVPNISYRGYARVRRFAIEQPNITVASAGRDRPGRSVIHGISSVLRRIGEPGGADRKLTVSRTAERTEPRGCNHLHAVQFNSQSNKHKEHYALCRRFFFINWARKPIWSI